MPVRPTILACQYLGGRRLGTLTNGRVRTAARGAVLVAVRRLTHERGCRGCEQASSGVVESSRSTRGLLSTRLGMQPSRPRKGSATSSRALLFLAAHHPPPPSAPTPPSPPHPYHQTTYNYYNHVHTCLINTSTTTPPTAITTTTVKATATAPTATTTGHNVTPPARPIARYSPSYPRSRITITRADPRTSLPAALRLFDNAISWLARSGRSEQWGALPRSGDEGFIIRIRAILLSSDAVWRAVARDGTTLGLAAVSARRPHRDLIPPPGEPEAYLQLLITDREDDQAKGVGTMLVERIKEEAKKTGVGLVRVDCYAGGDGKLVNVYERMGFRRMPERPLALGKGRSPLQVLEMRV